MLIEGFSSLELINQGTQTSVFKAKRNADKKTVALKVPTDPFPTSRQIAALKREYQVLSSLKGRDFPVAVDFFEFKNSACTVREWVDGITLAEYQASHQISVAEALNIGISIAKLLGQLHQQNFCHRDLSPANVLINPVTQRISLIDYCSALELPNRARNIIKPKFVEGCRAYMSPEQTGRMNRGLDFRTDFYSFGAVMYHLVCGQRPFETQDINEIIFSHIALEPKTPHLVNPELPHTLSRIILKLMSKSPDHRYQSAQGIEADLRRCLHELQESKSISDFSLAQNDLHDCFIIPDKIYGREREKAWLLEAFNQTSNNNGQLVFIAGHSGIGKTSLIKELYRPLIERDGYIASGKYDQILRHQPYSAFLQALSSFIKQIIAEEQSIKDIWRNAILEAIGNNGRVIIDVLPELEALIGPQPEVNELASEAASTRFSTTLYNFIYALSHAHTPLVLFIDDLQWIDTPSLTLLETLAPSISDSKMLIIGAYRDNEVDRNHPLKLTMPSLRQSCHNTSSVTLSPLEETDLLTMLEETIDLPQAELEKLNQLLIARTNGIPLIYRTMLTTFHNQGHVFFNYEHKQWQWDASAVSAMPAAENSVEMLKSSFNELPDKTLELLKIAACIGNSFRLSLLSYLAQSCKVDVAKALIPAVSKGYIQPLDDDFELHSTFEQDSDVVIKFSHDRVHQAVYDLVCEAEQKQYHWQIGQQLLLEMEKSKSDTLLFDCVEHLNQSDGKANLEEIVTLVELNLRAGVKAKQSAAYSIAYSCLNVANRHITQHQLQRYRVEVLIEFAQASYLVGKFEQAEAIYSQVGDYVEHDRQRIRLACIRANHYHHQGRYQESVEQTLQVLELLGIVLPDNDEALLELFAKEQARINDYLEHNDVDSLYAQREIEDLDLHLGQELLFELFGDAYLLGRAPLLAAGAATSVRISIENGSCPAASVGLINYATVLCSSGDYVNGYKLGSVAIRLADKYQNPTFKNYTYHVYSLGINHWQQPLSSSYHYWHEASKISKESGSPYAGWVFLQLPHLLLASGAKLQEVEKQMLDSENYLNTNHLGDISKLLNIIVEQPWRHLTGKTDSFASLDDAQFSTQALMDEYQDSPFFLGHTIYAMLRATLLARNIQPVDLIEQWLPVIENTVQAQIILVDSFFYAGLHLAANCKQLMGDKQKHQLKLIDEIIARFAQWAELCPINYQHKYDLLLAERYRLQGEPMLALDHYERSREYALESQQLMDAALSDELCTYFWLNENKDYQAKIYFERAIKGYEQWGATGKVTWLEKQLPQLSQAKASLERDKLNTSLNATVNTESFSASIDMTSVVKASQAISQHIQFDSLVEELLNLAVENAGATRGILLLEKDGTFCVSHHFQKNSHHVEPQRVKFSDSAALSHAIVRAVINIGKPVVYSTTDNFEQFSRCNYLSDRKNISVLCLPIIRQEKMSGILYLENTHVSDAFQPERIQTLEIIASQAAISLENAQMYRDLQALNKNLEEKVQERTESLSKLNHQLRQTNSDLYTLSTTDRLSGLYNRGYIEEKLVQTLNNCVQSNQSFSLLMLDIDHFKSINDRYGHNKGDRVIVNVSQKILKAIEQEDLAGRWGGEEFLVLCTTDIEGACARANSIRTAITSIELPDSSHVTASIGVTQYAIGDTEDSILNRVDLALYEAKNSGRNQVIIKLKQ
ncbi:signal transduction histidine kinase CheA [Vibrio ponticus]|nr:signal transduction histidine kinase CheA [Vibrio ponticus]